VVESISINKLNKVLLTGATGFVGRELTTELLHRKFNVVAAVRKISTELPSEVRQEMVGDLLPDLNWAIALQNIEVVIHAAARVHVMNETDLDPLSEFRRVNVEGTLNLASQAIEAGVKRFIFISSIKVNGEMTAEGYPFTPDDIIDVIDPYGLSKYEAEEGLLELAKDTAMEVVIIRPPLIYGPNVKANFQNMMAWVHKGIPLPFSLVRNKRSLLAIDNLVDFIIYCVDHPKAANEIFLVSDGEDVSIAELLQKVARALGKKAILFPVPVSFMKLIFKLAGKNDVSNRLFGSLQIDSSKTNRVLGWSPVTTMADQLTKTGEAFLNEKDI